MEEIVDPQERKADMAPVDSDQENQVEPDIVLAGVGADVSGDGQVSEVVQAGQDQEGQLKGEYQREPEQRHSHTVQVVGNTEAKGRGQQSAYSREVSTRLVTFACIVCEETVTQQRYPGHTPLYCSDACKQERVAARTRERVARHREKKKAEAEAQSGSQEAR